MPAASRDPNDVINAVTRAYNLSCGEGAHTFRIMRLAEATNASMARWNYLIRGYPDYLNRLVKTGQPTSDRAFFRSIGASSTFIGLVALEAFASIRDDLSQAEYERLSGC